MNFLTSLRGIAACLVVLFHIKHHLLQFEWLRWASPFIAESYLAVDFFFVLSGFIIAFKYRAQFAEGFTRNFRSFVAKRVARIYPLHCFVLLCYLVIPAALLFTGRRVDEDQFGAYQFALKLFLVDLWTLDGSSWRSWNVPSWTISGEFFAYLIFPAFALTYQSVPRTAKALILTAGVILLGAGYAQSNCTSIGDCIGTLGLGRCIVEFSLGVGICLLHESRALDNALARRALTWFSISVLVLFLLSDIPNYFFVPLLFSAILYGLLGFKGLMHKALESRPLVYLGDISYSIYLTHVFVSEIMFKLFLQNDELAGGPLLIAYLGVTLVFSALSYKFVEMPLRPVVYRALSGTRKPVQAE